MNLSPASERSRVGRRGHRRRGPTASPTGRRRPRSRAARRRGGRGRPSCGPRTRRPSSSSSSRHSATRTSGDCGCPTGATTCTPTAATRARRAEGTDRNPTAAVLPVSPRPFRRRHSAIHYSTLPRPGPGTAQGPTRVTSNQGVERSRRTPVTREPPVYRKEPTRISSLTCLLHSAI